MIVERIEVRGWRSYRDAHVFEFGEGMNLLTGPNEAGKSTILEALQRAFFDRHSGAAQEIKAIRPLGSSLDPEVELIVRTGGERMRIRKRFLGSTRAELWVERDEEWELDHEGDAADTRIREVLEGDRPHGAADARHRGLAQALWCLQHEGILPDDEWTDAVRGGLEGMIEVVASVPGEDATVRAVRSRYEEDWTPTGRPSKNSAVAEVDGEIQDARSELAELEGRLTEAARLRDQLAAKEVELEEEKARLTEALDRRDELDVLLRAAPALEAELRTAEERVRTCTTELERLERDTSELEDAGRTVSELETERDSLEVRQRGATGALEEARERRVRLQSARDDLVASLKELKVRERALSGQIRAAELRDSLGELSKQIETATSRMSDLDEVEKALGDLGAPSDEELKKLDEWGQNAAVARARIEASAVRVDFDLASDVGVEADPETERGDDGIWLVTAPTRFTMGDLGTVHVQAREDDLEAEKGRLDEIETKIQEALVRLDAESVEELRARASERTKLERRREGLEAALEDQSDVGKLEGRREDAERELRVALDRAGDAGDLDARDLADATRELEALQRQQEECEVDLRAARSTLEELALDDLTREATELEGRVARANERITESRERVVDILASYGTADHLAAQVESKRAELETAKEEAATLDARVERDVAKPRAERDSVQTEIDALRDSTGTAEGDRRHILGGIEAIARDGVQSRAADLEGRLTRLERRHEELERRARGAKLLKELIERLAAERAEVLAGPISKTVSRWMELLTGGRYDGLDLSGALMPTTVRAAAYGEDLAIDQLSHGTRQQLAVLLRLAIAVLVSRDERNLVVLDDRLVDSDPVRLRRLRSILEEVGDSCQIMLATCHESAYRGIDGRVIRVPDDGRRVAEATSRREP